MTSTVTPTMERLYDPKTFNPRAGVGSLIGRVKLKMKEAMDQELAPFDITSEQYIILVSLANGVDSASGLCKGVSYDPGAMTRMVDRLERKGLVRRVRSPEDRRVVRLALTDEGKAIYPELIAKGAEVTNRTLKCLSRSELQQLEGLLQKVLDCD